MSGYASPTRISSNEKEEDLLSHPQVTPTQNSGSLESAVSGHYQIDIGAIVREAWEKTSGFKGTFWLAVVIQAVILLGLGIGLGIVNWVLEKLGIEFFGVISQIIQIAVMMPMVGGLIVLGIRRSADESLDAKTVINYFHLLLPILGMTLLLYLLVAVGLVLLVLPGIYLAVAYTMALPVLIDKNLGPWEALEASRKAITHRWWELFALHLVLGAINLATVITLGIGLIWTYPMTIIAHGIVYRRVFGAEPATLKD